ERPACRDRGQERVAAQGGMTPMTTPAGTPLTERPAWKALEAHHREVRGLHLRDLFTADAGRAARFTREAVGLYADFSKHRITDETLRLLLALADDGGLRARIDAMFRGEKINLTEGRAVLHVALRAPRGERIVVDGEDVVPARDEVAARRRAVSRRGRRGPRIGPP